jgi:hypothetical protein
MNRIEIMSPVNDAANVIALVCIQGNRKEAFCKKMRI